MKKSTESMRSDHRASQRYSLITRADFDILREKSDLTLLEKVLILCGSIRFNCEIEYPSFTAEEIYTLRCHSSLFSGRPRIKLVSKVLLVIDANLMTVSTNRDWTQSLPSTNSYGLFLGQDEYPRYYAIADLNTDSGSYEIQRVLRGGPTARKAIIGRMPPKKIEPNIYERMEEEITKRINQKVLERFSLKHSAETILGITSWDS